MSENPNGVAQLAEEFEDCRRILLALATRTGSICFWR